MSERVIGDVDLSVCPLCGAKVGNTPQPSLHCASTFFRCGTHVIEIIGDPEHTYIDNVGVACNEQVIDGFSINSLYTLYIDLNHIIPNIDSVPKIEVPIGCETYRWSSEDIHTITYIRDFIDKYLLEKEGVDYIQRFGEATTAQTGSEIIQTINDTTNTTAALIDPSIDARDRARRALPTSVVKLDETEIETAVDWLSDHDCKGSPKHALRKNVFGSITVTTTPIGSVIKMSCKCGKIKDITNYGNW